MTSRGQRLRAGLDRHFQPLLDAALAPPSFDAATDDSTIRLGLSDSAELWLLPALLRTLAREAPRMRIVAVAVQFRNVGAALAAGLAAAVTVADELPATIRREPLLGGGFVCLHDPRHARFRRLSETEYFAREHVIVSYNGDLRGIVEELLGKSRNIRCSVSSFAHVGALVDGTALLATVPVMVARQLRSTRPHLATKPLPFTIPSFDAELLWPAATDDDEACNYVRAQDPDHRGAGEAVGVSGRGAFVVFAATCDPISPGRSPIVM